METRTSRVDLTRTVLLVLIIGALIVGCSWTLLPFFGALIWATTIVVPTWPVLLRLQSLAGNRRSVATIVMTLVVLILFVVPLSLAVTILLQAAIEGAELLRIAAREGLPAPPAWLEAIPLLGPQISARWSELAVSPEAVTEALRPFLRASATWALALTGGFAAIAVHFLLTVIIVAILYSNGEKAARGLILFGRRLGADRGERVLRLAARALRSVALGVVVTALVQSIIAGLGLWLAGVPQSGVLLALIFVLCIAQLGPLPVLLPAVAWLLSSGEVAWGVTLLFVTLLIAVADNVLKPLLIRRGVDLSLLLIIPGVIGGLLAFGVVGLFVGPVLLAVTFTLVEAWVNDAVTPPADAIASRAIVA